MIKLEFYDDGRNSKRTQTDIPDAMYIRMAEMTGYSDGVEPPDYICPICGAENPDWVYQSVSSEDCLGCSECVIRLDVDDVLEKEINDRERYL